jgi:hypothetical protein
MSVPFVFMREIRLDFSHVNRDDDDEYLYGESLRDEHPTTSGMQHVHS